MAWLDKRGDTYRLVFQVGDKTFKRSLKTSKLKEAEGIAALVQRRILLLQRGDLTLPDDVDLPTYLITDGKISRRVNAPSQETDLSLAGLCNRYLGGITTGSLEKNTIATLTTHLKHVRRILGAHFRLPKLTYADLQRYVDKRAKEKGMYGKTVMPYTIRKELTSFGQLWTWAARCQLLQGNFPKEGLRYPRSSEKPKFQTWREIERQLANGELSKSEEAILWKSLYLTADEIDEVLSFVECHSQRPFMYPMLVMAAHTGARRSELLRSQVADIDFTENTLLIREKKRVRGKETTRSVPLSPRLRRALEAWLINASRRHTFYHHGTPLTVDDATLSFNATFAGSKWEKLKGWHVFRHSFISNFASKGIDQRMIDAWSGHQTDEMRKRYTHLIPTAQQTAFQSVFGA